MKKWPYKRGGLWWVWSYKRSTTVSGICFENRIVQVHHSCALYTVSVGVWSEELTLVDLL
jgi:hypothetical protein